MADWHLRSFDDVLREHGVTPTGGLAATEAARRLAVEGPNELEERGGRSPLAILREQLTATMVLILIVAAVASAALGKWQEAVAILAIVVLFALLGFVQEYRAERAMAALKRLAVPVVRVRRDGALTEVPARDLVRGDVVLLEAGALVPADLRLVEAVNLRVQEAALTGESDAVEKTAEPVPAAAGREVPLGDRRSMAYMGTTVGYGRGAGVVVATGMRTELGRIADLLQATDAEPTPLQRRLDQVGRTLAWVGVAIAALIGGIEVWRGQALVDVFLTGVSVAVAVVPEGLPAVVTITLALGARRMLARRALIRKLPAVETLGSVTTICSDKTGTLTENRMTVTHLMAGGLALNERLEVPSGPGGELAEPFHALVEVAILASVVDPFDPMEKAFHRLGRRFLADTEHLHRDWRLVQTYALSPALRAMSHVWASDIDGVQTVAAKGAPEAVIDLCHLGEVDRARIAAAVDELAAKGLRVLGVARGRFEGQDWPADEHGFDFEFVGLLGLADPVRAEVPAAVAECRAAGIRVVMITGDYPATARAIARQAGLADGDVDVLSGDEIASLSDEALRVRMAAVNVCARISPNQKLRIVQALKARGEIVAMTGDGVNDAPALRAAHVGVAMGKRGTDVARESSSLVLVDDNFASIVRAIRLGRRIFDNLRKAMSYILAVHVPIAGMALLPVLLGWPPLLYPMHIALLELIIDPACSVAFENEPAERDVMQRPPRDAAAPLFGGATLWLALLQGVGVLIVVLLAYAWASPRIPEAEARAFAFATLVTGNLALILSNRSSSASLWTTLRTPNAILWWVIGGALLLLAAALYLPWTVEVLRFAPLPAHELAAAFGLGLASVVWFEAIKRVRRESSTQGRTESQS